MSENITSANDFLIELLIGLAKVVSAIAEYGSTLAGSIVKEV